MKDFSFFTALLIWASFTDGLKAQELYVFSEPASNMPAKSIGVRLTNEGALPSFRTRTIPEVMVGLNKNLMFHLQGFFSDMSGIYKAEGTSFYMKYRFLSIDNSQSHLRAALFGRISTSNRNVLTDDINLEGDNKGVQGGLIVTQLLHKLALSGTFGYALVSEREPLLIFDPHGSMPMNSYQFPNHQLNYSLSSGYLLLPFVYKDYNQPNFNLYFEVLGSSVPENGKYYVDFAPALQLILKSRTRIDLGYRFQAAGNMHTRNLKNMYLVRLELNFFNTLTKKQ